jgi:competence protein ComGC
MSTTLAVLPKPRSRRRWYWIGGFVLLVILTPFLVSFIAGWWSERRLQALYAEIDAADPDWRWPDLCARLQPRPGEPNSAAQIEKIHALHRKSPLLEPPAFDSEANTKILNCRNSHLNVELTQMLRTALDKLDPAVLLEARKLKDMPNGRFAIEPVENPSAATIGHRISVRGAFQLLHRDAMMRGQEKDFDGAIESCQAMVNAARSLRENPTLIAQFIRLTGYACALEMIERTLGQGEASEQSLKNLQELLEIEAAEDGLYQAMRGERAIGHQLYLSARGGKITISEIDAAWRGSWAKPGITEWLLDAFPGFLLSGYPDYLRLMNEHIEMAKLKDAERAEAFSKLDEKMRSDRTSMVARIFTPMMFKTIDVSLRSHAMLRCSIVAVAAERYRLKHDRWPSGMKELIHEGLLKEEYADPYDGKPLRWKRTPTGLIIYSINKDKIDDGGKLVRENVLAVGSDLGIELWDPTRRRLPPPVFEEVAK